MKSLAVKDFAKYQHYSKRNPPWIKLYATVLTDLSFLQLPEAAQAQLMKLWILASQFGHPLPNDPKLLAGKIGTTGKFYLAQIIDAGFLIPCNENASKRASKTIADPTKESPQNATALSTEGREQSSERETTSLHGGSDLADAAIAELAHLLAGVPGAGDALTGFMEGLPSSTKRLTWARSLITSLHPIAGGKPVVPAALAAAMADFNLTDRSRFPYTGAVFRAFADKAMRDLESATTPTSRSAAVPRSEHWTDKKAREEQEESDRQMARSRSGNVDQRRARPDGAAWYARMQREAKALGRHPTLYAYDHMQEAAEVAAHA